MNKRFLALDAFRGIAAVSVVVFHMNLVGSITELDFFKASFLFVEFFFVLSGFVLAHSYGFKNVSFKRYFISRTFRLYPLHLFMFCVFFLLELGKLWAYGYGFEFNNAPFSGSTDIREILPNLLFLQSWLPMFDALSWNTPSWSLSVEYYMYMIFFASLFFKRNIKYFIWLAISAISFYLLVVNVETLGFVLRGLSCFFAGCLAYLAYQRYEERLTAVSAFFFSIFEIFLLGMIFFIMSYVDDFKGVISSVVFVLAVFVFAFEKGVASKFLRVSLFQKLGKLSYSIYMTHVAVLFCLTSAAMVLSKFSGYSFSPMIEGTRYLDFGSPAFNNIAVFLVLLFIVFISTLTYSYVEVKGQEMGRLVMFKPK